MEFTWKEVVVAIFASGGIIGGLLTVAQFIAGRLDKRRERRDHEHELHSSSAVESRRIALEEARLNESIWEHIADQRQVEIIELRKQIQKAKSTFTALEDIFRKLRVAKIPDEVVDIIAEKLAAAYKAISEARDQIG